MTWADLCTYRLCKKDIIILVKGPMQGLEDTRLTVEAEYSIKFTDQGKKFCEVYIKMEATVIYLLME